MHAQSHFNFHFCSLHFGKLRVHIEVARLDRYVGALWKKNCILWPLVNYSVIRKNTRLLCCQIQLKMHFLIKAAAISKGLGCQIVNILKLKRQHNIIVLQVKWCSIHSLWKKINLIFYGVQINLKMHFLMKAAAISKGTGRKIVYQNMKYNTTGFSCGERDWSCMNFEHLTKAKC